MTNLSTFNFNTLPIRTIDLNNLVWFVATDVCNVLGLTNPTKAISNLDDDERTIFNLGDQNNTLTNSKGNPNVNIINESGLYALIFRSRKSIAKKFRKWVTSEVLPSIRQTGTYTSPTTLTPAHQRALQEAVARRVGNNRQLFPKVWGAIKSHFRVGTYKDLPDASFDLALSFVQLFKLSALPAPVDPLKAISIKARTHARDAANALNHFGEGYKDPEAIYDGSRLLDQDDMEILRRAKHAIADLEDAIFFRGSRLC